MWQQRLRGSGLWLAEWLRHQRRDAYWQHGSICENYADITCPVLAVSGWADGYTNSVFRLLAALDVPRKGLIGPWSHKYPHLGQPGPAVGFLQELVRWWDHWLRDVDNDVMAEPMLRIWMQESVPPSTAYEDRPGRWVGEPSWPSPHVRAATHPLGRHQILPADDRAPAGPGARADRAVPVVGGPVRREVVLLQRTTRPPLRPTRGGRRLADLRRRPPHRADGDPRRPGGAPRALRGPAGRDGRRAAGTASRRRGLRSPSTRPTPAATMKRTATSPSVSKPR